MNRQDRFDYENSDTMLNVLLLGMSVIVALGAFAFIAWQSLPA